MDDGRGVGRHCTGLEQPRFITWAGHPVFQPMDGRINERVWQKAGEVKSRKRGDGRRCLPLAMPICGFADFEGDAKAPSAFGNSVAFAPDLLPKHRLTATPIDLQKVPAAAPEAATPRGSGENPLTPENVRCVK